MSDTYVTLKVKEALKSGQGSRAQAMRLLVAMALTDEQLLRGLCKPYLPAICGGAVDRLFRGQPMPSAAAPARSGPAKQPVKRKLTPQMLDAVINRMGQPAPAEPTRRPASFGPEFGQDFDSPPDDDTAQADSLKTLAKAFRQR
jgi:hypothetical protein